MATGAAKAAQDQAIRRAAENVRDNVIPDLEYHLRQLHRIFESNSIDAEHVADAPMEQVLHDLGDIITGCWAQVHSMPDEPTAKVGSGFRS